MKKKLFFSLVNFVSIFWFNSLVAQEETKIIEIIQAGGSTQDQQKFPGANILVKKDLEMTQIIYYLNLSLISLWILVLITKQKILLLKDQLIIY